MKRKLLIGIVISLAFVALALRGVDWTAFVEALKQAVPLPLAASSLAALAAIYLRAWRWQMMLAPVGRVGTWRLYLVLMIGSMANNVLPARLGDLARAYLLGRSEQGISKSAALATVVYERIVDVFFALALLWVALLITPGPPWLRRTGLWILALNSVAMVVLVLMVIQRERAAALAQRLARPLGKRISERVREICDSFISGLAVVTSARSVVPIVFSSAMITVMTILPVYFSFFGMKIDLSFAAAVSLTVWVYFGTMIPAAPGNVGPIQYACIVGLALHQIDRSQALAYSLVYHATHYVPITLLGMVCLWREQLKVRDLAAVGEQESAEEKERKDDPPAP
jgi:uncharacterized protein (TIRG00374 family)